MNLRGNDGLDEALVLDKATPARVGNPQHLLGLRLAHPLPQASDDMLQLGGWDPATAVLVKDPEGRPQILLKIGRVDSRDPGKEGQAVWKGEMG